jgi:hypothetical protein
MITERYLRSCDEIFAVCNIGRAATDAGVIGVFDLARQAKLSNVGIVCTKSDVSIALTVKYKLASAMAANLFLGHSRPGRKERLEGLGGEGTSTAHGCCGHPSPKSQ